MLLFDALIDNYTGETNLSVKLRLTRLGRKKRPYYRIIAVDSRKKRDGAYLEKIGYYHPLDDPPGIKVDADKALKWLRVGAQPSDTVRSLLRREGVWLRFRMEKRGLTDDQINEAMTEWFAKKKEAESEAEQAKKKAAIKPVAEEAAPAPDTEKEAAVKPVAEEVESAPDTKKETAEKQAAEETEHAPDADKADTGEKEDTESSEAASVEPDEKDAETVEAEEKEDTGSDASDTKSDDETVQEKPDSEKDESSEEESKPAE